MGWTYEFWKLGGEGVSERINASIVGYFEDYDDERTLEVAIAGLDENGDERSLSFQRSTYGPERQEIMNDMDSYNVSNQHGFAVYGCLRNINLVGSSFFLELAPEDAAILGVSEQLEIDMSSAVADMRELTRKLVSIVNWGALDKRPGLVGMA